MTNIDLNTIPTTPGVYMFKDAQGRIVYVGKAKQLRKRVSSYFRGQNRHSPKTAAMLAVAENLDILSTNTEKEALLLEASLIKKHRPRYNIVLRDDKQYLLFYIDKTQPFPRLSIVRPRASLNSSELKNQGKKSDVNSPEPGLSEIQPVQAGKGKGVFYGPYTSALAARETWRIIHRIFPLRRCSNRSFKNRVRPCLYYHLAQCLAPCVLPVSPAEYNSVLQRVEMFLNGRSSELVEQLQQAMYQASDNLEYETAAKLRDQINAVKQTLEKQSAVLHGVGDLDVIALAEIHSTLVKEEEKKEDCLGLGILFVRQGQVLGGKTFYWPGLTLAEGPEVLLAFITQFYDSAGLIPGRILIPWEPTGSQEDEVGPDNPEGEANRVEDAAENPDDLALVQEFLSEKRGSQVYVITPRSELEKRLVSMAATNAREGAHRSVRTDMAALLAAKLDLPNPVERIEAVDVSHTGGKETRVGLVVYENGQPIRDEFRAYIIKDDSVSAGDDYAALAHWAGRRAAAGPPWPDLLLIDGGRGQLTAVDRALADAGLAGQFGLAAIAKARTEEGRADRRAGNVSDRIFVPGRVNPLNFKPGAPELLFLQRIRDAVHDQAIGKHRRARDKAALAGELVRLPGVGPKTAKLLWDNFNSLREMAEATEAELAALPGIGKSKAALLRQELQKFK